MGAALSENKPSLTTLQQPGTSPGQEVLFLISTDLCMPFTADEGLKHTAVPQRSALGGLAPEGDRARSTGGKLLETLYPRLHPADDDDGVKSEDGRQSLLQNSQLETLILPCLSTPVISEERVIVVRRRSPLQAPSAPTVRGLARVIESSIHRQSNQSQLR